MKITHQLALLGFAISAITLTGCSEMGLSKASYDETDTGYSGDQGAPEDPSWDDDGGEDNGVSEEENDFLALMPAQTDVYVFIANPGRSTITRVNVYSMQVDTTEVGNDPTVVTVTPDYSRVAVFNNGDDTVDLFDSDTLEGMTVKVRDNFNTMVMSPNGTWVALWHSMNVDDDESPGAGLQSFNEVSFVNVVTGEHFPMAVGFNPREIQFTPDDSLAIVVSDEYLGLVDLLAPVPSPNMIQVAEDLLDPPLAEEVEVAPDGSYAFVRQFGAEEILVVDLVSELVTAVPVGSNPTDLDLSPDGTEAIIVSRGSHEVYVLDVADPVAIPPEIIDLPEEYSFGSVLFDPTGEKAMIYTTATALDRYATWDRNTDEVTVRSLVKPVAGMAITPTGNSMLVFHNKTDVEGADTSSPFYNEWALTMVDLDDFRTNPLLLPAEPTGYANSTNGQFGYFIMENQPYLEVLRYDTLLYDQVVLKSDPVYVGVLPDLDLEDGDEPPAWVSQEHQLGRLTFFDPDEGSVETITGFELNAHIED